MPVLNLTPEEQERLSYIQGNTIELALIYQAEEAVLDLEDELNTQHNKECNSLISHIRYLESKLSTLDADFDSWFE